MKITNIHQNVTESDFLNNINRGNSFVPPKKGDGERAASLQISEEAQKRFEESIVHFDRRIVLPEYCGIYGTDKTIATAVESCSKEEQAFVYDIIRQNFLLEDTSSLSEEERQANIALGLKKAQYAAENFIPEEYREEFMDAMNTVAKLASAGTADQNGKMNYGVPEAKYLGHGSNLVATTNDIEMMRIMDSAAYKEYQRIGAQSSNEDRRMNQLKYMVNWLEKTAKARPGMLEEYEAKNDKYMEEKVKNQVLPSHFDNINVSDKEAFLNGLRTFMDKNPNFMSGILARELSNRFWVK